MGALKSTHDICYHLVFGDLALDLLNQNLQRLAGHSVCWTSPWGGSDAQPNLETAMRILRERDRQDIYKKKVKTTGPTQEKWGGLPMLHNGKKKKSIHSHPSNTYAHIHTHTQFSLICTSHSTGSTRAFKEEKITKVFKFPDYSLSEIEALLQMICKLSSFERTRQNAEGENH